MPVSSPSCLMKADEWLTRTESGGIGNRPKIAFMLREYHALGAAGTPARLALLAQIEAAAAAGQLAGKAQVVAYALLGLTAHKERSALTSQRAVRHWKTAAGRVTSALDSRLGKGGHHINEAYWLEAIDPRHRSWGHIQMATGYTAQQYLLAWMNDRQSMTFWEWCKAKGLDALPSVQYLAPDERWRYMVEFSSARRIHAFEAGKGMGPLSTAGLSTVHSGPNFAVWVASQSGLIFTGSHELSKFHHSSFLSGKPVLCGGEWMVREGVPIYISHKTGHYQSSAEDLMEVLKLLDKQVDLGGTLCQLMKFTEGGKPGVKYVTATELLRAGNPKDAKLIPPPEFNAWQAASRDGGFVKGVFKVANTLIKADIDKQLGVWSDAAAGAAAPRTITRAIGLHQQAVAQAQAQAQALAQRKAAVQQAFARAARAGITFFDDEVSVRVQFRGAGVPSWYAPEVVAAVAAAGLKFTMDADDDASLVDTASGITIWRKDESLFLPEA